MDLLNTPNLCAGAKLAGIVFCCSTKKECPFRDKALEILGISKEDFERVKTTGYSDSRLCYGDLGFCCSLEEECKTRDQVMKELGLTPGDYIALKRKVLGELKKVAKNPDFDTLIENEAVAYKMVGRMVITNTEKNPIYVIAIGNPELSHYFRVVYWERVEEKGGSIAAIRKAGNQIVSLRLDNGLLHDLDMISKKRGVPRSQLIREILVRALEIEKSENEDYLAKAKAMKKMTKNSAANCSNVSGNPM